MTTILDNQTKANIATPLFALAGSGSGSSNINSSTLTLIAGNTSTILDTFPGVGRLQTFSAGSLVGEIRIDSTAGGIVLEAGSGSNEVIFASNYLYVPQLSTGQAFFSSIEAVDIYAPAVSTQQLDLDGQVLTADSTDLLLNGIPIATTSNLSSLSDWALDPAISSVSMAGFDLFSTNRGVFSTLIVQNAVFKDISTTTLTAFSTLTVVSTLSSLLLEGSVGNFSTLNANTISTAAILTSSLGANNIAVSSINGQPIISSLSNWSQFPATSDVNMSGSTIFSGAGPTNDLLFRATRFIDATATSVFLNSEELVNPVSISQVSLIASGGNRGRITLEANPGLLGVQGEVVITANGGSDSGVILGGLVTISANTPLGVAPTATSAIKMDAAGINSYAGAIPSVGSLAGYNFVYGTAGVNICSGLPSVFPNLVGSTYIYGSLGVGLESGIGSDVEVRNSDFATLALRPRTSALVNFGDLVISGRNNLVAPDQYVQISNVKRIDFESGTLAAINNLSTINGQPLSFYEPTPSISSFQVLATSTLNTTNGQLVGISSINGQPLSFYEPGGVSTVSSFTQLFTSSLGASTILTDTVEVSTINMNGTGFINWDGGASIYEAAAGRLFLTTGGATSIDLEPTQISFNEGGVGGLMRFFDNTLEVTNISTGGINVIGSIQANSLISFPPFTVLYGQLSDAELVVGTLSDPNDLGQVAASALRLTSSISASNGTVLYGSLTDRLLFINDAAQTKTLAYTVDSNISVSSLAASTIQAGSASVSTLLFNGISTISFSTAGAAGLQSQPAGRLFMSGNDIDMNSNDIWVHQIRVGAGNPQGSAQSEVIIYAPDNSVKGLGIGSQDRTLRVVSTVNGTTGGYLLDTTLNPPFFSTINNTSTALMAYFPSTTLSTIGVSTISYLPVAFQPTSAFNSTILYTNLSTTTNCVISTTITVPTPCQILAQANTTLLNRALAVGPRNSFAYLQIGNINSPSTITTLAPGAFNGQTIAFRSAVSSGTTDLKLFFYASANGDVSVNQAELWAVGSLAG